MYRSKCALASFLDHFGDKWSLLILRDLFIEKKTFNDFLSSDEGIASNVLTNRIKSLMKDGLIDYKINPNNKKVKWYYLTDKAVDVYPVIIEMVKWSDKNIDEEFGPISKQWIKENNTGSTEYVSNNKIKKYINFRNQLFAKSLIKK
ncbi:helix-turn-helix transcriptional regulator [Flavobacteriaceae bacterium]|nr:helix-turn-helix transcriptional regulator [Flavobacteriaceae bacterium]